MFCNHHLRDDVRACVREHEYAYLRLWHVCECECARSGVDARGRAREMVFPFVLWERAARPARVRMCICQGVRASSLTVTLALSRYDASRPDDAMALEMNYEHLRFKLADMVCSDRSIE